jgi:chorismate mutase
MKTNKIILTLVFSLTTLTLPALAEPDLPEDRVPPHHISPHYEIEELKAFKTFDEVALLMQKRLAAMHEVARWKWNHGVEIDVNEGEERMGELVQRAMGYGIPLDWAKQFIIAQLDAGIMVQSHDFEIWKQTEQGPFEKSCDFESEIDPYLEDIFLEMLEKLGEIFPYICENYPCYKLVRLPLSQRECDAFPIFAWRRAIIPFCSCLHPGPPPEY